MPPITPALWLLLPAIFFGLYSASFIHAVRWLLFEDEGWRIRKKINWWLVTTSLLVFFLSATLWCTVGIISLSPIDYRVINALNSSVTQWSSLLIIDGIMIYRCWIMFPENRFIICFPVALWCSCLICNILSFYCQLVVSIPNPNQTEFTAYMCFLSQPGWMPMTFYVCNIVINIYTTSALVYKIWHAAKNNTGTNRLYRICRILTESGILYTLSSLIFLISWIYYHYSVSSSEPYFIVLPAVPMAILVDLPLGFQIVLGLFLYIPGIAFNVIIIRVGEQRAKGEDSWVDFRDNSIAFMPSEQLNQADASAHENMGQDIEDSHGRIDEREVREINETEDEEIMEVNRSQELPEGQA